MTPEEFYWKEKLQNRIDLFDVRVRSISWVLDCFNRGTIRKSTIKSLITEADLEDILQRLVELERYEDCITIKELIDLIYIDDKKQNNNDSVGDSSDSDITTNFLNT